MHHDGAKIVTVYVYPNCVRGEGVLKENEGEKDQVDHVVL